MRVRGSAILLLLVQRLAIEGMHQLDTSSSPSAVSTNYNRISDGHETTNALGPAPTNRDLASEMAAKGVETYFRPSLDSMEMVDFLLLPALLVQDSMSLPPAEPDLAGVRFHSVISEQAASSSRRLTWYIRYWVTSNSYQLQILWTEPNGFGTGFPFYGPGHLVSSTRNRFKVSQAVFGKEQEFQKPIEPRPTFRYMFGDYPAPNLRFAEAELLKSCVKSIPIPASPSGAENFHSWQLASEERQIEVGFHGPGVKVFVRGVTNQLRELRLLREPGARRRAVKFAEVKIGDNFMRLPCEVEVRNKVTDGLLISARISGFKAYPSRTNWERVSSDGLACFSPEYREYLRLIETYGSSSSPAIPANEKAVAARILGNELITAESGEDGIERLQHFGVALDLARLLEHSDVIEMVFVKYLQSLCASGSKDLIVASGYSAIDRLVMRGNLRQADNLLKLWLSSVRENFDWGSAKDFEIMGRPVKSVWAAAKLAEELLRLDYLSDGRRFELEAAQQIALQQCKKLSTDSRLSTNTATKAYASWITHSIDTERLNELLLVSKKKAKEQFEKLGAPTEPQSALARRAALIDDAAR